MASKAGQVLATLGNVDDDVDAADDDGRGEGKEHRGVCEDRTLNSEMELQRVSSLSVVLQCCLPSSLMWYCCVTICASVPPPPPLSHEKLLKSSRKVTARVAFGLYQSLCGGGGRWGHRDCCIGGL